MLLGWDTFLWALPQEPHRSQCKDLRDFPPVVMTGKEKLNIVKNTQSLLHNEGQVKDFVRTQFKIFPS